MGNKLSKNKYMEQTMASAGIKFFENGLEIVVDESNFEYVLALLENKINEIEELDKQCFFIASAIHDEVVYWYCDSENALLYAELIDKKVNKYLIDLEDDEMPYLTSGFLREKLMLKYVQDGLRVDLKTFGSVEDFAVKKLDSAEFVNLPNRLSKQFVKSSYLNRGLISLERVIKCFLEEVKDDNLNTSTTEDTDTDETESETENLFE